MQGRKQQDFGFENNTFLILLLSFDIVSGEIGRASKVK